jgi:hemolysin activation/secretion protein
MRYFPPLFDDFAPSLRAAWFRTALAGGLTALGWSAACAALAQTKEGTDFVLPPLPPPSDPDKLANGPRFVLRGIRVDGATLFDAGELETAAAAFIGRTVGTEELQEIRLRLTRLYIAQGYVSSGATLPDQTATDGIVLFRVVEGKSPGIEVTGLDRLDPGYVRDRLAGDPGSPLNIRAIEQRQRLLLQDPNIARINAEVTPGIGPGDAILKVNAIETPRFALSASFANDQTPSVGAERGETVGTIRDPTLLGLGDDLTLHYGRTAGANDGGFAYGVPIDSADTRLTLRYDINDAGVVDEAYSGLDIRNQSETLEVELTRPVWRTLEQTLTLGVSLAYRKNDSFLLGEPFAFAPGTDNGKARLTVLRLHQDWVDRDVDQVLAVRSILSVGLPLFGATHTGPLPNRDFVVWLGQAQYVRQIIPDWEAVLRSDAQFANRPLFSLEQYALGGMSTVRGYRENLLVRDNAVTASAEIRAPLWRERLPYFSQTDDDGLIQLAPFIDFGSGWNTGRETEKPRNLLSLGIGLRWEIGSGTEAQIYYGHGLTRVFQQGGDLQDQGVHFKLTTRLY